MFKRIFLTLSLFLINFIYIGATPAGQSGVADNVGNGNKLDVFGSQHGGIRTAINKEWTLHSKEIYGTLFYLSIAMIITVMASGVFNYQENLMKSVIKVLVTLIALGVVVFWAIGVMGV